MFKNILFYSQFSVVIKTVIQFSNNILLDFVFHVILMFCVCGNIFLEVSIPKHFEFYQIGTSEASFQ